MVPVLGSGGVWGGVGGRCCIEGGGVSSGGGGGALGVGAGGGGIDLGGGCGTVCGASIVLYGKCPTGWSV